MPQAKIRFALVPIESEDSKGNTISTNYYRGDEVFIENEEYERLAAWGAVVPVALELERPGSLMSLPESPSDEELLAWVANATDGEVASLALERPHMVERIHGAKAVAERNHETQMKLLGRAEKTATKAAAQSPKRLAGSDAFIGTPTTAAIGGVETAGGVDTDYAPEDEHPLAGGIVEGENDDKARGAVTPDGGTPGATNTPEVEGGPEKLGDTSEFDDLVANNYDVVTQYISEHPGDAAAILDAEVRKTNGHPRKTIVASVEAAAGHTQ